MHGFYNRILRIDLTTRETTVEPVPDEILAAYLGGKGLGTYLLLQHVPQGADPLSSQNVLIIATGPATGSGLAPASRYGLYAKSPLTGLYGESYAGGFVAPQINATGYDAILLEGASSEPVYLEVSDQGVRFRDARGLWGLDTHATEDRVKADVAVTGAQAIVIGPAGENLVPFALVNNNYWRHAGRTGMGAVMGSKKVKAVVFHGQAKPTFYDPAGVQSFDAALRRRGREDPGAQAYREFGTPRLVATLNKVGGFPARYWSQGRVDHWSQISAEKLLERFDVRSHACYRCFMACGKISTVPDGPHAGLRIEGPEYETIYAFGGLCMISDLAEIIYLNELCDRLGMDTITAGNVIALVMEASQRGVFKPALDYGDAEGAAELLEKIARQEGIGKLLSGGVRAASAALGLEDIAVHVKGLEPAGYDPRVLKGMGLAYAVSDRGACHLRATVYKAELSGVIEPDAIEGKAQILTDFEDRHTLFDTLIFCRFYRDLIGWDELAQVIYVLTGLKLDKEGLAAMARNITTRAREFNLREGMTPADDALPERFHKEPLEPEQKVLSREELRKMLDDYYALKGW